MADNTSQGGSDTIATDELLTLNGAAALGEKVQRVKVGYGDDGDLRDASAGFPLPIVGRPITALGHYRLATTVPLVVTQAANGTLFSFRWGNANLAIIQKLRLAIMQTAAQTATQALRYQAFMARSFTASDSAGTAITITGNNLKKRTSMGTTLVTDIRKSAVAAGLTAGTRTLDAEPILEVGHVHTITNINANVSEKQVDLNSGDGQSPWVLAQNEGLIVRGPTAVFGAAGTADLLVELAWAEVAAY